MRVIEALYLKDEEPHDYLHIKHESASPLQVSAPPTPAGCQKSITCPDAKVHGIFASHGEPSGGLYVADLEIHVRR
jgi:hypothetical protein